MTDLRYPEDFWSWTEERRNEFFAEEAKRYSEKRDTPKTDTPKTDTPMAAKPGADDNVIYLARLDRIEYDRRRAAEAEKLGCRVSTLIRSSGRSARKMPLRGR